MKQVWIILPQAIKLHFSTPKALDSSSFLVPNTKNLYIHLKNIIGLQKTDEFFRHYRSKREVAGFFLGILHAESFLVVRSFKQYDYQEDFKKQILALRLYREGGVNDTTCYVLGHPMFSSSENSSRLAVALGRYSLADKDVKFVKYLLKIIKDSDTLKEFDIAIEFFNEYYYLYDKKTKIVGSSIVLENLLSPDDQRELRHRIALRAAFLLGKFEERVKIYNDIGKLYILRSNIVHGGKIKKTENILQARILFGDYTRRILRRMIYLAYKKINPKPNFENLFILSDNGQRHLQKVFAGHEWL